jgi:hypothetical protein
VFGYVVTAIALVCAGAVAAILALAALGKRQNGRRLRLMPGHRASNGAIIGAAGSSLDRYQRLV